MMFWLNQAVDALALTYALLLFPGPLFWFILHPAIGYWRRHGNRSFWVALPVWLANGTALILLRGRLFSDRFPRGVWTWLAGAGLVALGAWIDYAVSREFSWRRLVGIPEVNPGAREASLVISGIYARIRHPRYTACMLTFWGLAFLTGAPGIFLLAILTVVMYLILAPIEEKELREQYQSEYDAYARAVPRFVPSPWRQAGTTGL